MPYSHGPTAVTGISTLPQKPRCLMPTAPAFLAVLPLPSWTKQTGCSAIVRCMLLTVSASFSRLATGSDTAVLYDQWAFEKILRKNASVQLLQPAALGALCGRAPCPQLCGQRQGALRVL